MIIILAALFLLVLYTEEGEILRPLMGSLVLLALPFILAGIGIDEEYVKSKISWK